MNNNGSHNNGSGFLNGLVMGAVIGSACVFFLGTKKGKQVLKALTENGLENFSGITDIFLDEEDMDPVGVKEEKSSDRQTKRFFRGIKK